MTPGTAQALPLQDAAVRAVIAATAAHWFDRPLFSHQAWRVLQPSGLLAIIEYVRDQANSDSAAAVVDFLARHGGTRAYTRPDYHGELRRAAGFRALCHQTETVTLPLSQAEFVRLALSSSRALAAIETLGEQGAADLLLRSVDHLKRADGVIPYGYVFHLFTVRRR